MVSFNKVTLLSFVSAACTNAATVNYNWTIAAHNIALDGFTRSAALINNVYPGLLLKANKGVSVNIHVDNQLNDPSMRKSTSIVRETNISFRNDGPSFVTQCPIAQSDITVILLKIFLVPSGKYQYHSHLSTQYVDGIHGPLVIYDPLDPHRLSCGVNNDNTVITLTDWYHTPALISTPEPIPDSGLINSAGRYAGGPTVPRTRINVLHGLRYRFRIVSVSAEGFFDFAIDNHTLTIIESDGISTNPYTVDSIAVLPGQRYSAIVSIDSFIQMLILTLYDIRSQQIKLLITTVINGTDTYAVLHYTGASNGEPTTPQPVTLPAGGIAFAEYQLSPLVNPGAPGGSTPPDVALNLTFGIGSANGDVINGVQYQSPTVPTLLNILANGATNASNFGTNENTFVLPYNATVEVSFIGGAGHAFHLHGHAFDVIQSASGGGPNYVNPPRRDVVASGGTVANPVRIRFRTDNPGPWFVHCHIDWHLEAGLAAVFAEDPNGNGPLSIQPNAQWQALCNTYNALDPADK
ncbi:multicopper oxidase [Sphaerobolus stellatus SS14]|uniref:Multicopper oxidase n=1 Tax=Sphaerobolus stellatus (strain SS14) TaxID=990650 RepID=A0A0C9VTI1_SPHS4|nr:multicopper oxidase [Sphaerobolus stellatus SS14]